MSGPDAVLRVEAGEERFDVQIAAPERGSRLTGFLRRTGVPLNTRCGERGICNGCLIELQQGSLPGAETGIADASPATDLIRACRHRVPAGGGAMIVVPARSRLAAEPSVVSEFTLGVSRAHDPLRQQVPAAEVIGTRSRGGRDVVFAPGMSAPSGDEGYLTLEYRPDRWLAAGATPSPDGGSLGLAIDVGTTTVAALLVDLDTGEIRAEATRFNRQMTRGEDVLTRIDLCRTDPGNLDMLHRLLVEDTLGPMVDGLLEQSGADRDRIECAAAAGNTTMLHLLAEADPSPLGVAPFTRASSITGCWNRRPVLPWPGSSGKARRCTCSPEPRRTSGPTSWPGWWPAAWPTTPGPAC